MGHQGLMRIVTTVLLLAVSLADAGEKLAVYAVNYPLQYFAQRIAGEQAEVILPVPPAIDPAFWQPDVAAIAGFQQADIILLNGAGYAQWVNRVSLPRRKLVDTSAGFRDRYIHTKGDVTHSHGREGDHSHTGTAFTTWLDFTLAVEQARAVADALSRQRPGSKDVFARNLAALEKELLDLDRQVREIVATEPDRPLMASHPVYQYSTRRYGLNLQSVMWEPDMMPDAAQWSELARLLTGHPADWMIWEGKPNPESVTRLRSMGVDSLVFDPCGNRPGAGDFLSVMQQNVQNLERGFQ
ncbi:MAG: metal ABC transporter substrate-binding protein [Gammaproteobacteria bacterium]|nr:metal ABC transporter substrate-binding protein [Gammaproteobacteria bacterium]